MPAKLLYRVHLDQRHTRLTHFLTLSLMTLSFVVISVVAVFFALGYHLNWVSHTIQQTGVIRFDSDLSNVQPSIYLNGQLESTSVPYDAIQLLPGQYSLTVQENGHQAWSRSLALVANRVYSYQHLVLVHNLPLPTASQRASDQDFARVDRRGIDLRANELWLDGQFITRLSGDIQTAIWYPDHEHLAYQVGNQVWFCEADGLATEQLLDLPSNQTLKMAFLKGGRYLAYQQADQAVRVVELY